MSPVLVTGATGSVGYSVTRSLLASGRRVRAMVRSVERAKRLLPEEVELVAGDLGDAASLKRAVEGCGVVYHAAGLPEQWLPDPTTFDRVNVDGTRALVDAAVSLGVDRFVYTSTIDVFDFAPGTPFDESRLATAPKVTAYQRSKQAADRIVTEAMGRGLPAIFLHPSAVYGPAPAVLPGTNDFVAKLSRGEIPLLLPGGMPVVFAADVAEGHRLAELRGEVGARYILSESYQSLVQVGQAVAEGLPGTKVPPVLPRAVARAVSEAGELLARITGRAPLIPRGQLHFLGMHVLPNAEKARKELGWQPTEFDEGLRRTLDWLAKGAAAIP